MKCFITFTSIIFFCIVNAHFSFNNFLRKKRDVAGSLDIVTNHAQPIHAELKSGETTAKVTPPKDGVYEEKSLRKSLPRTETVDLIRSVSRAVTLIVLLITAILEFFPVIQQLYYTVIKFIY